MGAEKVEIRKVRVDHKNPPLYRSLDIDQKRRHYKIAVYITEYCVSHENELVPWGVIDNYIPHLYSFVKDNYNSSHQKTEMIFDNDGVRIVRK